MRLCQGAVNEPQRTQRPAHAITKLKGAETMRVTKHNGSRAKTGSKASERKNVANLGQYAYHPEQVQCQPSKSVGFSLEMASALSHGGR